MDILFSNHYVMCSLAFNKIYFNLVVVIKLMFVAGKRSESERDLLN